jgi:hypothetical protein
VAFARRRYLDEAGGFFAQPMSRKAQCMPREEGQGGYSILPEQGGKEMLDVRREGPHGPHAGPAVGPTALQCFQVWGVCFVLLVGERGCRLWCLLAWRLSRGDSAGRTPALTHAVRPNPTRINVYRSTCTCLHRQVCDELSREVLGRLSAALELPNHGHLDSLLMDKAPVRHGEAGMWFYSWHQSSVFVST